jgi:hypothetical protein
MRTRQAADMRRLNAIGILLDRHALPLALRPAEQRVAA